MVSNAGAQLWVLGIKSEGPFTIITSTNGGATELLGGLLYPVVPVPNDTPAFVSYGGGMSLVFAVSAHVDDIRNYRLQVLDSQGSLTEDEVVSRHLGSLVPLYATR